MHVFIPPCMHRCIPAYMPCLHPCTHALPPSIHACNAMPCHAMPCHAMPCHAMPFAMPCIYMCYVCYLHGFGFSISVSKRIWSRLDFRVLGPVGKDLNNGPFAEAAFASDSSGGRTGRMGQGVAGGLGRVVGGLGRGGGGLQIWVGFSFKECLNQDVLTRTKAVQNPNRSCTRPVCSFHPCVIWVVALEQRR